MCDEILDLRDALDPNGGLELDDLPLEWENPRMMIPNGKHRWKGAVIVIVRTGDMYYMVWIPVSGNTAERGRERE